MGARDRAWLAAAALVAAAVTSGCAGPDGRCIPPSGSSEPPGTLEQWCMLSLDHGQVVFKEGVEHFELNTPLFSDGATKIRTFWMPTG